MNWKRLLVNPDEPIRDEALRVLMEIARDDDAELTIRGQCAEVALIDIREHRSMSDEVGEQRAEMNAQISRMEDAYLELREAMDALPQS